MPVDNPNVGVAFALVTAAGLATALGAAVVFFPALVKLASRRVLAGALGLSAGVMTYVSFVEIFQKSQDAFSDSGLEEDRAYVYATLCFFGGVVTMLVVDAIVKLLSGKDHHHHHDHDHFGVTATAAGGTGGATAADENLIIEDPHCPGCSSDPVGDLEKIQKQADQLIAQNSAAPAVDGDDVDVDADVDDGGDVEIAADGSATPKSDDENNKLVRMGINTAIAIGLHNFPEGLATFVAALDNPRVGAVLAIAIGIHNVPEGLCVAMPIYYATGNRLKAFLWALLSGASEPLAALLGWAILANSFSDQLFAILFGFVGGMMVIISTRELLPTAHRYDPEDTVVTFSFIGGMVVMALSLVLFVL